VSGEAGAVVFSCPESVRWVEDADRVIVVDKREGETHMLRGAEAAVWGWLTLAYPYPKLVRLLAALLARSTADAEQRLAAILQDWCAAGLLQMLEPPHG